MMPELLVEVIRGEITESLHLGHIAVADGNADVICCLGNPDRTTYFRSAAKPFLMIAALSTGIAGRFGFDSQEIAVMTSSHSGQHKHIKTLERIISKLGIEKKLLQCGIHPPLHKESEEELYLSGSIPTTLHCNCSGKHLAIVAASMTLGLPLEKYYLPEHPIQQKLAGVLSDFCRVPVDKIKKGIEGCGLPVYGVPLRNMACAYANLVDFAFMEGKYAKWQDIIIRAMVSYPWYIGGDERLDTDLMLNFGDRLVSKIGAEGAHCAGLLGKGTGTALRIDDGNLRAVDPAACELLRQLGVVRDSELDKVRKHWRPPLVNHRKENVGEIRAVYKIRQ